MADTERTKTELLALFADDQIPGSIGPQDMRDYVVTTDNVDTRFTTGLITGGEVTINGGDPAKFDIAAGEGAFVDNFTDPLNPERVKVSWSGTDFLAVTLPDLAANEVTFIGLDLSSGTAALVLRAQEFTPSERRDFVTLAPALHSGATVIDNIGAVYSYVLDERQTLVDLGDAVGQINLNGGNVFSPNVADDLTIDKSIGSTFFIGVNYQNSKKTPNTTVDPAQSNVPAFFYTFRDGAGGFLNGSFISSIDPTQWDDNTGAPIGVQSNKFTIQRGWFFPLINFTILHYGQTEYGDLATAKAAINTEVFDKNPNLPTGFRFWLIIKEGTTNLVIATTAPSGPNEAEFIQAGKFGDILRP